MKNTESQKYLLKKAKQAARRAANDRMDHLTPDVCYRLIVRPKPRIIPAFLWHSLCKIVLKIN